MSCKFFISDVKMPRRLPAPIGSGYAGRQVKQPAHESGKSRAPKEYGDAWDTAWVCGTVSGVRTHGTTSRKPVMVTWSNIDEQAITQAQMAEILVSDSAAKAAEPADNFT